MSDQYTVVARKPRSAIRERLSESTDTLMMLRCMQATLMVVFAMIFSASTHAAGQSSANFVMKRDAINAGIGDFSSTNFRLSSSVGDAVAGGAIGSVSFQLSTGFRGVVNAPPAVLNLLAVLSRKFHNGLPFDLTIADTQPISGPISVEPRAIGAGHVVVFRFDSPITAEGAATALDAALNAAATVTLTRAGNDVIATLTNVADNQRLNITLSGVNGSATAFDAAVGFLVGDVGSTYRVTAADISAVKAHLGNTVNSIGIAKFDLNADGSITQADVSAAKTRAGQALRP